MMSWICSDLKLMHDFMINVHGLFLVLVTFFCKIVFIFLVVSLPYLFSSLGPYLNSKGTYQRGVT